MNWKPLEQEKIAWIAESVGYTGRATRAGELYQKIRELDCPLEDKVRFILRHWGWDGTPKKRGLKAISEIQSLGFVIHENAVNTLQQFYDLSMPMKRLSDDESGGCLIFYPEGWDGWIDPLISSEYLSIRFGEDIISIGVMEDFFGGENVDGWEDSDYHAPRVCNYTLFMGKSEKIYLWEQENSDYIGTEGENLIEFFASCFGLIPSIKKFLGYYYDDENRNISDKIEELLNQGTYQQNCFRKKKPE